MDDADEDNEPFSEYTVTVNKAALSTIDQLDPGKLERQFGLKVNTVTVDRTTFELTGQYDAIAKARKYLLENIGITEDTGSHDRQSSNPDDLERSSDTESDVTKHVPPEHPDQADAIIARNPAHFGRRLSIPHATQQGARGVRPVSTPGDPLPSQHRAPSTQAQQAAAQGSSTSGPDKIHVYQRGTHTIKVYEFDITKAQVDAIVNPVGKSFKKMGQVSEAIYEKAGRGYKRLIDGYVKDKKKLDKGECVLMDSLCRGALFKHVLHVRGPDDSYTGDKLFRSKKEALQDAVTSVLKEVAKSHTINSVAFPAIGTGNANMKWDKAVREMVNSVVNVRFRKDVEVHLVGYEWKMSALFKSVMDEVNAGGLWKTWTENGYPGSSRSQEGKGTLVQV